MNLNDFRQKIPQLNGLDDQAALDLLHKHYYPDVDKQRMADVLGVKTPPPPAPERSMARAAGDLGLQFAGGAVSGVRMMSDLFGANNAVSTGLRSAEDALRELQSAAAKADQQRIAEIMKEAESKGFGDQVIAGVKAFGQAPAAMIAQALGTSVPTLATALIPGVGQGAMAARLAAGAGVGAAQGAGNIKGVIYEEIKNNPLPGETPEQTEFRAVRAQEYGGQNTGQIALGGVLGAAAGSTGMERALSGLRNGVTQAAPGMVARVGMGAAAEAVPEIAQGGQEKLASNLALRNEGFDVDPMAGVVAGATMEGLAGGLTGGVTAIPRPAVIGEREPVPVPVPPVEPPGPMTKAVNALGPRLTTTPTTDLLGRNTDPLAGQMAADRLAAEDAAVTRQNFADRNGAMLAGGGLDGSRADPLANMLADARTSEANSFTNVQQAANRRPPMPASDAARILDEAKNRGMDLTAAPHPDGGFVVVPRQWVTPDVAAQAEAEIADTLARMQQADAAPVERAERRRSEPVNLNLNTDPVAGYIDDLRNTNTPAARAYVGEFDAGRVTRADVEQRMRADRGKTADERLAEAAAEGLKLNPKGDPFKTLMAANLAAKTTPGTVIEVPGGYAIRPQESTVANTAAQEVPEADAAPVQADEPAAAVPFTDAADEAGTPAVRGSDEPGAVQALSNVQDAPQPTTATGVPTKTRQKPDIGAAAVEAPAPARGDGAAAAGVPDAGDTAGMENDGVKSREVMPAGLTLEVGGQFYPVDSLAQASEMVSKAKQKFTEAKANGKASGFVEDAPIRDGAGRIVGYVGRGGSVFDRPDAGPRAKKLYDAGAEMAKPNAGAGAGVRADGVKPETVEIKDNYGRKHQVRKADLDGNADRIPTIRPNGDVVTGEEIPRSIIKPAEATAAEPFEHAGLKIRTTRTKVGNEVVDGWLIQSPENAEREARGERQIGGDRIVETREQAIKTAEQEAKRYAKEKADRAEIDAQDKARRDADEAKKEANRGKTLLERRADAILDKPGKFPASAGLGLGTKREAMDKAIEQGRLVTEVMVDDTAAKKRDQDAVDAVRRAGYILGASNENIPVVKKGLEAQARLKEGKYQKPEYRVYQGGDRNGSFFEITKTEYDYVQKVKANPPAESKPDQETKAKAEPKAENLPEGWDTLKNGYTGLPVYRFNQGAGQPFAVVTRTEIGYEVQIRHGDKLVTSRNMRGYATGEALDIATQMLGEASMATHKDPGEKAEPATKAVVNESLKTAAKNEDAKPSEMRKWLLGEIDKALLQAPDRADYDEAVKRMGEKDAVSMFTGNGFLGKNAETGFVTFDVPGDGKFKVRNSTRGLLEFRKNVSASLGFKDSGQKTVKPEQNEGVQSGSGGQMAAITNMIEEGDFEAARDYAEAVGIKLEDVKVPRGERKPQWDQFLKDGTVPPPPDTRPLPPQRTPAQIAEDERLAKEAEAKKPNDTGWNMAGTGYGGKRYRGRNITTADGREIVARVYENAGNYDEVEVKVDGVRKFTVRDSYNAQDKADAFVKTLMGDAPMADKLATTDKMTPRQFDDWIRQRATIQTEQFRGDRNHGGGDEGVGYIHLSGEVEAGGTNWAGTARGGKDRRDTRLIFRTDDNKIVWYDDASQQAYEVPKDDTRLEITRPEPTPKQARNPKEITVTVDGADYTVTFDEPLATISNQAFQDNLDEYGTPGVAKAEFRKLRAQAQAGGAEAPAAAVTRRDPAKVSMFNPYEDGDIVTIDGQDWTVKQDTPGWYLTNTGNWRGTHPTIRNIKAMADLIRAVEQAAVAQPKAPKSTKPSAEQRKVLDADLLAGSMSVDDYMNSTGLTDDDVGTFQSDGLRRKAEQQAREASPYHKIINKMQVALTEQMKSAMDAASSTPQQRKSKQERMARVDRDRATLDMLTLKFEHPFDNSYVSKLSPIMKSRFNKQFDGVKTGALAKSEFADASYRFWAELLIEVANKKQGITAADAAPAQQEATQATDDRDTFTLKRLNRETNKMEPVTFKRGEYIRHRIGDKDHFGEIDGISQARREFSVDGLWYPMGFANKAERPAAPVRKDMAPLSSVIDKMNAKNGEGLTEADRVPEQKPASKTPTVDRHEALMKSVREGKATAEQFKAAFESLVANKDAVLAELETKTKAELLKAGGYFIQMRYASEKKGEVIDAIYRQMVGNFVLGETLSYGMGKGAFEAAVRRHVEATDDAKLEQYAKDRQAAIAEAQAERAAKAAAMDNPQTLADFKAIIAKHIGEGKSAKEAFLSLTPEQRIQFDTLAAESTREAREARKRERKTEVRAAGQTTGGEIIATKHTRDGYDLFVVKLADRLSREDYTTVLASAKKLGGWYSAFRGNGAIPGFQFKDKANAEAFLKLAGGDTTDAQAQAEQRRDAFEDDRSETAVERLRTMADKLAEQAAEIENADRKTNTARRARFAASALNGAAEMKAKASTMRNIAQAIEAGGAKFLDAVRTKSQVDLLTGIVATAKNNELRAKYPSYADQEKRRGEPATAETADFAEFPAFTAYRSDLASLGRQLLEVDGTKKLGQRLMSVADDVSDAYLEFAKQPANLFKLSTFSVKRGDEVKAAIFPNREQAERAIARSGLTGKAIVLAEKRGVNRIIMSPSEAINAGIWTGDGDKRITLSTEFGNELVEAIGRRGNKSNKLTVPWQFQNAYDRRKALSRMGIETPSEYRSALREFIGLQERAIANKVKEMELAMVGRKADGLDFFPTPAEIADQMIEAADITPDMAVLEPSAGMGHIADRIREAGAEPDVIEISPDRRELLLEKGYHLAETDDFMAMEPRKFFTYGDVFRAPDGTEGVMQGSGGMGSRRVVLKPLIDGVEVDYRRGQWYDRDELTGIGHRGSWSGYDRIIMNPPFSNRRDAEHVMHAYTLLKPGGRIVAIMGEGVFFGQDKKAQEFREWLESVNGTSEKLPPGSFMDPSLPVNTGVSARMVVIDKPAGDVKFSIDDSTGPADTADYGPATQAHRDAAARLAESFADRIENGGSHTDLLDAVAPGDGKHGQAAAAVASIARRLFRRQVVFVKFKGTPLFNGVVSKSVPGVVFLNIDSQKPLLSVLGHELLHEMAKSHPTMYANLSRRLDDLIKNETEYAIRTYTAYKKAGISTKGLDTREELEADIVGDNFMDAGFWQAMGENQPGLFRRIVNFVTKWLDNLAEKIADYRPFGTDEFLTDIAAARDAVASAMREFSGAEAGAVADPVDGDVKLSAAEKQDQTQTAAFKRWFAGSKVVDAQGRPLVVYHGTRADFDAFGNEGGRFPTMGRGFYFTSSTARASVYADGIANAAVNWNPESSFAAPVADGANIVPVYLSIKNPLMVSSSDGFNSPEDAFDAKGGALVKAARDLGHDGVIFRREKGDGYDEVAAVAFRPEQIKSATGNRGTFDPDNADIRFSVADDIKKALPAFDVKTAPKNSWAHYRGMAMQALGRRQIVDLYAEELPQLAQYDYLVQQMDAEKNDSGAEADKLAQDWGKLKDEKQLAELMHDATLAQIDPAKPMETGVLQAQYRELKARFDALTPEAQALYRQARDMYDGHYRKVQKAIKERIERSEMSAGQKRQIMAKMDEELFKKLKGVYFPLARFGQYVIVVKDANGEVKNVTRAETVGEAEEARKELHKAFPKHMGYTVGKVLKQAEFNAGRDAVGKGFMADLMDALDAKGIDDELRDTVAQLYLSSLPDLSWAKHGIHRKGTPGFSQDARRAFAQNMFHGARYLAKLRYADQLQDELIAMQEHVKAYEGVDEYDSIQAQQVVDEMVKRHEVMMNPKSSPVSTALTSLGFVFHLGLSPASAMVNLSQTALVAYPMMGAKWGWGKASAALLAASQDVVKAKNDLGAVLQGAELDAYERAVKDGTIDVTMAHDLAGISQGEDQKVFWKIRPVMRAASFMFHHAERFNRQATFIAAWRMAKEAGPDKTADQLYEEAKKLTYDSHFDYSASNRPRVMQGNWQRVIFLFKQYAQAMVYTLSRNAYLSMKGLTPADRALARKNLGGILATHAAAAGVLGLPLVGPLLTAASFIGSDDDEPWDAEVAMQNVMADMVGPKAAEVMARGFSRLTPFDLSGRVALNKLILPDVQEGLEGKQWAESAMAAALGPVAGIGVNMARGFQKITDGHYMTGLEDMMPTALRGPLKAMRYASEGAVDKTGVVITDEVGPGSIAGQALGFSPSEVRRATERKAAIMDYDRSLADRRSALVRQWAEAQMAGDTDGVKDVMAEIQGFNQKNPNRKITMPNLIQSVRARRRRIEQAEDGVYLPKNREGAREAVRF